MRNPKKIVLRPKDLPLRPKDPENSKNCEIFNIVFWNTFGVLGFTVLSEFDKKESVKIHSELQEAILKAQGSINQCQNFNFKISSH
jgi:hypothetical protein